MLNPDEIRFRFKLGFVGVWWKKLAESHSKKRWRPNKPTNSEDFIKIYFRETSSRQHGELFSMLGSSFLL